MYADDVVLRSSTETGLQNSINKLWKFADDWHMHINCEKTKIVVFNKSGRLKKINITVNSTPLECVQKYTYLGTTFSASGTFCYAKENIYKKGMKALFKLRKSFENDRPRINTILHIFDHTITSIFLYGSEIWGIFSSQKFKLILINT